MFSWLSLLLSEAPGEPSIRRVLCLCAFLFGCALCLLGLRYEISGSVKDIAIFMLTSAFGAVTAGRFAEAIERNRE
jgi:uncharacterized membrane protein